ncbi:MAG: FG-GAP repeat protein, partial [Thermoplasmata archaeon]|nr:FG-GAP repeat protein [Thermoplasmata archaeon]
VLVGAPGYDFGKGRAYLLLGMKDYSTKALNCSFPTSSLDTSKWDGTSDGIVSNSQSNSPTYSFQLDNVDFLLSQTLDLASASVANLSYWWKAGPQEPESGDILYIDLYLNISGGQWSNGYYTIYTGGSTTAWQYEKLDLPVPALWYGFKLRFRTNCNSGLDDYYIDDVEVLGNISMGINATLTGNATGDRFGWSVNATGDLNGDGNADIIIGAPGYSGDKGRAYIIHGKDSMGSNIDADNADIILTGSSGGDRFGYSVTGSCDINNDGTPDVAIGAPFVDYSSLTDCGAVYLFCGANLTNTSASNANETGYGEYSGDHFGWSVVFAGDINGDGFNEILCGAPHYDTQAAEQPPSAPDAGKAYALYIPEFASFIVPIGMIMILLLCVTKRKGFRIRKRCYNW